MKIIKIVLTLILIPVFVYSQASLSVKRVDKLRKCVVRILVNDTARGTGFYISPLGEVATCQHLFFDYFNNTTNTNNFRIQVEQVDGIKYDVEICDFLFKEGYKKSSQYDYCILKLKNRVDKRFDFYILDTLSIKLDGSKIYSAGYPFGIEQQLITSGIISNVYETKQFIYIGKDSTMYKILTAYLDLTMNRGNSGGPIILQGKNIKKDRVIGLATFINSVGASQSDALLDYLKKVTGGKATVGLEIYGQNIANTNMLFAEAIANNSVGISACYSAKYVKEQLIKLGIIR